MRKPGTSCMMGEPASIRHFGDFVMAKKKKKAKQQAERFDDGLPQIPELWQQAHRQAMSVPLTELVDSLSKLLSRRMTAQIAGVKDGKTITRWATGQITEVRDIEVEQRLRASYEIIQLLLVGEAESTVRAWFLGLNPLLHDSAPLDTLAAGQLKEAVGAARAFGEADEAALTPSRSLPLTPSPRAGEPSPNSGRGE